MDLLLKDLLTQFLVLADDETDIIQMSPAELATIMNKKGDKPIPSGPNSNMLGRYLDWNHHADWYVCLAISYALITIARLSAAPQKGIKGLALFLRQDVIPELDFKPLAKTLYDITQFQISN